MEPPLLNGKCFTSLPLSLDPCRSHDSLVSQAVKSVVPTPNQRHIHIILKGSPPASGYSPLRTHSQGLIHLL